MQLLWGQSPGGAFPEMTLPPWPRGTLAFPGQLKLSRVVALLPATPVVPSCVSAVNWGACTTCRTSCTDRAYRRCGHACASSCRCCWRSAGHSPQTHTGTASPLWTANGACCGHRASRHVPRPTSHVPPPCRLPEGVGRTRTRVP